MNRWRLLGFGLLAAGLGMTFLARLSLGQIPTRFVSHAAEHFFAGDETRTFTQKEVEDFVFEEAERLSGYRHTIVLPAGILLAGGLVLAFAPRRSTKRQTDSNIPE